MIASVHGTVQAVRLDAAVVEVGGVGLLVHATPATLAGLRVGSTAQLATSLVVREDALTLFGFADDDEREIFETVQTVSGVGPRLALAMLAVHTPDGLRRAVARRGPQGAPARARHRPARVPSASCWSSRTGSARPRPSTAPAAAVFGGDRRDQVVEALVGLGWNARAAGDAVSTVLEGTEGPVAADEVAGVLRAALRTLGGGRG